MKRESVKTIVHIFVLSYIHKFSKYKVYMYTTNVKGGCVRNSGLTCVIKL